MPDHAHLTLVPPPAEGLEFALLNLYQRNFPLTSRPFATLAQELGCDETSVIQTLQSLQARGVISRVGAVFRPNVIGASALAALSVPPQRLEQVAAYVSSRAEINHNYEREHRYNLWFVAAADSQDALHRVLQEIESACACGAVLVLPMIEDYHIDLGFDLSNQAASRAHVSNSPDGRNTLLAPIQLNAQERRLVAALQDGLPLQVRPYADLGWDESSALCQLDLWIETGLIKRFGVVVRHHELGYRANAMLVWDIPDQQVGQIGRQIGASGRVNLCYQRPRRLPDWPYNLFCMLHGQDRAEVETRIAELIAAYGLHQFGHEVLFSRRRFKQCGARYVNTAPARYGSNG